MFRPGDLANDLSRLGLTPGCSVYVHTSFKSIGGVEGGPDGLIEAFLEALGPGGTLAVPCHSLSFPGFGKPPYSPADSPGMTGVFPEAVRKHTAALRSAHPSHSSAALGARAREITADHDLNHALAFDSPLHRLYRTGGMVLLLGVGHTANTSLHLAESLARMPYVRLHYDATWGDPYMACQDGTAVSVPQREYPGCSDNFGAVEELLLQKGIIRRGPVGNAPCRLMDMKDMVDFVAGLLRERPEFLLCGRPDCPACPQRREMLETLKGL